MVDGVGLVAVLGRGVAQPDVVVGVVGGQGDGAVSRFTGHGQRTIGADRRDGPGFPVADGLAGRGDQGAVVAARGDNIVDVSVFAAGDLWAMSGLTCPPATRAVWTVWLMASTWSLVEATTATVTPPADAPPHGAHCGEVIVECCGDDLVVGLVSVKSAGITASQLQRSGRLPRDG